MTKKQVVQARNIVFIENFMQTMVKNNASAVFSVGVTEKSEVMTAIESNFPREGLIFILETTLQKLRDNTTKYLSPCCQVAVTKCKLQRGTIYSCAKCNQELNPSPYERK